MELCFFFYKSMFLVYVLNALKHEKGCKIIPNFLSWTEDHMLFKRSSTIAPSQGKNISVNCQS